MCMYLLILLGVILRVSAVLEIFPESECVDGVIFSIVHSRESDERADQARASDLCDQFDVGQLAPLFTLEEYLRAFALFLFSRETENTGEGVWIGLFDDQSLEDRTSTDPRRFQFTDGTVQEGERFFDIGMRLPWRSDQPNQLNQHCVRLEANGFYEDQECDKENNDVLCRQVCAIETLAPTVNNQSNGEPDDSNTVEPSENSVIPITALSLGIVGVSFFILLLLISYFQQQKVNKLENELKSHQLIVNRTFNS